ncbi:hypothetical protein TIFTF001_003950, partial [Ficus carica]
IVSSHSRAF